MVVVSANATAQVKRLPVEFERRLPKGVIVEVEAVDLATKIVSLKLQVEPDIGPNRARLEDFSKATPNVEIKKDPEALVGNVYTLDAELMLLSDVGVKKITDKLAPKPKKKK